MEYNNLKYSKCITDIAKLDGPNAPLNQLNLCPGTNILKAAYMRYNFCILVTSTEVNGGEHAMVLDRIISGDWKTKSSVTFTFKNTHHNNAKINISARKYM